MQCLFVKELFIEAGKLGIHRTLDTAGYCHKGNIIEVLIYTDRVLFSIKVLNQDKHKRLTGAGNEAILKNLALVVESGVELIIRYVLIPGVNDLDDDARDIVRLIKSFSRNIPIEILPYHKLGIAKWECMGIHDPLAKIPPANPKQVVAFKNKLRDFGVAIR